MKYLVLSFLMVLFLPDEKFSETLSNPNSVFSNPVQDEVKEESDKNATKKDRDEPYADDRKIHRMYFWPDYDTDWQPFWLIKYLTIKFFLG